VAPGRGYVPHGGDRADDDAEVAAGPAD
jgi:hypothetical protein